jgi:hypothetical protein
MKTVPCCSSEVLGRATALAVDDALRAAMFRVCRSLNSKSREMTPLRVMRTPAGEDDAKPETYRGSLKRQVSSLSDLI